ncbi:MAG: transporter substrate-binding domain-containing protein [Eubacterium sp.]|nr:transporter substrate-binding domain-containing protein [Eubacterium sp.]
MKKLAMILAAVMAALSFTACSGSASDSDTEYVKNKGTLIVGMTDFAPMDYRDGNEWVGFDADMAKAFAADLGVEVEFIEITWGNKHMELDNKSIDIVWNGMTLTDDVKELMATSEPYCKNAQVVVTKADVAGNYKSVDDIKSLSFAVEDGSAGAEALDEIDVTYTAVDTQAKALMEVASGSVDACVIDLLMAGAMIGEGTSYDNLNMTEVSLSDEVYGVGFRKDSDLVDTFNTFWAKAYSDGTVMTTAEKYGIAKNMIAK